MNHRTKKHPRYYAVIAYQLLSKRTDEYMANLLGISVRTYKEKINGYSDFTQAQGDIMAREFGKSKDEIFLT